MVLHDYHSVALICEAVQHLEQLPHVLEMHAGSRLIEHIDGPARARTGQFTCQLDPLSFAARKRGRRLPQLEVPQTNLM